MIDCARWVMAEAWIANGLRVSWGPRDDGRLPSDGRGEWQGSASDGLYRYVGWGQWEVPRPSTYLQRPYGESDAPQLTTDTMQHELAHWLVASEEQRGKPNFGMDDKSYDAEQRAVDAERVISSVIAAASRVVGLAVGGQRR